jgi:hypothetical protein
LITVKLRWVNVFFVLAFFNRRLVYALKSGSINADLNTLETRLDAVQEMTQSGEMYLETIHGIESP